jgi:protoheme ferro-lyase
MTCRKNIPFMFFVALLMFFLAAPSCNIRHEPIGVLYVLHGGMDTNKSMYMWDASVQMFTYDQNHPVYKFVIKNPAMWPAVLNPETTEFAVRFLRKYEFTYDRIGGTDPFQELSEKQLAAMKEELNHNEYGLTFEVDWTSWLAADHIDHLPFPRFFYNAPGNGNHLTYCGEGDADGPWENCNPERYNVDGPVEKLLKKGVSRIIMIDMTVGGMRFYKSFDVVQMAKRVINQWNEQHGTSIPLIWVNDYSNLMERSYPEDEGWTSTVGPPQKDRHVLIQGSPNPIAADPELAAFHVKGIEARFNPDVSDEETGVLMFSHGLFDPNRRFFDPKIDDVITLQKNIKTLLIERHPTMNPEHIIGGFGGVKQLNPLNGIVEVNREMRGENLAHSYYHEGETELPEDEWGYRYWEALEYLKNRGVKHIVVDFTNYVTFSVLVLEVYNQISKEIGVKTWLKYSDGDFDRYPVYGNPFADYWGNWANTDCGMQKCCFTMGGCGEGYTDYPPPRQGPLDKALSDLDPSLVYDNSDYGHLGYNPALGPPDSTRPVQEQYSGTWDVFATIDDNPLFGKMLAQHVLNATINPLVYITNKEVKNSITAGESIVWQAHVSGGKPPYRYEWSIKKQGTTDWRPMKKNRATWTWGTGKQDTGSYNIRCKVHDSMSRSNEVVWEGFNVL